MERGSVAKRVRKMVLRARKVIDKKFGGVFPWVHWGIRWGFIPLIMHLGFKTKPWIAGKGEANLLEAVNAFW